MRCPLISLDGNTFMMKLHIKFGEYMVICRDPLIFAKGFRERMKNCSGSFFLTSLFCSFLFTFCLVFLFTQ